MDSISWFTLDFIDSRDAMSIGGPPRFGGGGRVGWAARGWAAMGRINA